MDPEIAVLAELLEEIISAYENGDGENQAIYRKLSAMTLARLKAKYPGLEQKMLNAGTKLWALHYQTEHGG